MDGEYLEKAIFSLPEGFRMVFTLIEIEGYSHKEVAAVLGISEGTSKSQLFYAIFSSAAVPNHDFDVH